MRLASALLAGGLSLAMPAIAAAQEAAPAEIVVEGERQAQEAAVRAFQRRWRPQRIDGQVDGHIGALLFELLLERDLGHAR